MFTSNVVDSLFKTKPVRISCSSLKPSTVSSLLSLWCLMVPYSPWSRRRRWSAIDPITPLLFFTFTCIPQKVFLRPQLNTCHDTLWLIILGTVPFSNPSLYLHRQPSLIHSLVPVTLTQSALWCRKQIKEESNDNNKVTQSTKDFTRYRSFTMLQPNMESFGMMGLDWPHLLCSLGSEMPENADVFALQEENNSSESGVFSTRFDLFCATASKISIPARAAHIVSVPVSSQQILHWEFGSSGFAYFSFSSSFFFSFCRLHR